MAVLCEFFNVIVPINVLRDRYPGGIAWYQRDVPNRTFATDGVLTRVGFKRQEDLDRWVAALVSRGLKLHNEDGSFADIAIIDQLRGPIAPCEWVVMDRDGPYGWARPPGHPPQPRVAPATWHGNRRSMARAARTPDPEVFQAYVRLAHLLADRGRKRAALDALTKAEEFGALSGSDQLLRYRLGGLPPLRG